MLVAMDTSSSPDHRQTGTGALPRGWNCSRALTRAGGWTNSRSREARFLRAYAKLLADQLGGEPSDIQKELIRRAARTALRLELLDTRMLTTGDPGDAPSAREYVSLNSVLIRILRTLGMAKVPAGKQQTLADYVPADDADGDAE